MHDWCFTQPLIINQPTSFGLVSMIQTIFLHGPSSFKPSCFFHSDLAPLVKWVEWSSGTKKNNYLLSVATGAVVRRELTRGRTLCSELWSEHFALPPNLRARGLFCLPEQSGKKWRKDQDHHPLRTRIDRR